MADLEKIRLSVSSLGRDNTSGAAELASRAAEIFIALSETRFENTDFFSALYELSREIIRSQPSMSSVLTLANDILLAAEDAGSEENARGKIKLSAKLRRENSDKNIEAIAAHSVKLLSSLSAKPKILTHSYSFTVIRALIEAKRRGLALIVICTESRPAFEGATLARKLADENIKVIYAADMLAFSLIWDEGVDVILVGGDALMAGGLVNKAGTFGLAVFADEFDIPMYALAGSEKFLPESLSRSFKIAERPPEEVMPNADRRIDVVNRYFDITPLRYIRGVVSEEGILSGNALLQRIQSRRVSARLLF